VIIEDIATVAFTEEFPINPIKAEDTSEPLLSREEKIKNLLRINHLNPEERKALINISNSATSFT